MEITLGRELLWDGDYIGTEIKLVPGITLGRGLHWDENYIRTGITLG